VTFVAPSPPQPAINSVTTSQRFMTFQLPPQIRNVSR